MKKNNQVIKFFPMILLILFPFITRGQETRKVLTAYFKDIRSGKMANIPQQLSLPENAKSTLSALSPYFKDTVTDIRSKAYTIAHLAGSNSKQADIRQEAVKKLLEGAKDQNSGNAGLALSYLTHYKTSDFSPIVKDSIKSIVKRKPSHFEQWLKLSGFVEIQELKKTIRPYTQPGNPQGIRWAALVSLARMGDAAAIQDMMKRVQKLKVNDDLVYKIFPDLVYTRQKEAMDYMVTQLKSDEKNCMSADSERETAIPCGYRIMEQLAPAVKGYPLQLDESGDIKTKDYVAALATVRDWFSKNPNYTILRDTY